MQKKIDKIEKIKEKNSGKSEDNKKAKEENVIYEPEEISNEEELIFPGLKKKDEVAIVANYKAPAELIVEIPDRGKALFPIQKDLISIGRSADNDLLLDFDFQVSGRHAQIFKEGDRFFIEDLKSTNHTYINEAQITTRTELKDGDKIEIGNSIITFLIAKQSDETEEAEHIPLMPDPVLPPLAELIFTEPDVGEVYFPLDKDMIKIGRSSRCDLVLSHDPEISGKHARITREDGRFFIEDLKSTNHTFVNRVKIVFKTELKDKDKIKMGDEEILFSVRTI